MKSITSKKRSLGFFDLTSLLMGFALAFSPAGFAPKKGTLREVIVVENKSAQAMTFHVNGYKRPIMPHTRIVLPRGIGEQRGEDDVGYQGAAIKFTDNGNQLACVNLKSKHTYGYYIMTPSKQCHTSAFY